MSESEITERVILAVIKVHQVLGPGFLERVYHNALSIELQNHGLLVECEKEVTIYYENEVVGVHRLDLLVEDRVVIELKTVEELSGIHYAQLRSYLRATNKRVGLLINLAKEKADYRPVEVSPS